MRSSKLSDILLLVGLLGSITTLVVGIEIPSLPSVLVVFTFLGFFGLFCWSIDH